MKKNMGNLDKLIRLVVALAILIAYKFDVISGTFGLVMVILGGVFVLTSLVSFCPLYLPFGINTDKSKEEK